MKHTSFEKAPKHHNGSGVTVSEYGGNANIDGAHAEINGSYPPELGGWAVNHESDMQVFVHAGEGKIEVRHIEEETGREITRETRIALGKKASILVSRDEKYRIDGDGLELFIASTPSWNPEQAQVVYE